jgi:hypothetical protein
MTSENNEALQRANAETSVRIKASASSIELTNLHLKASQEAVDRSLQTLASTDQHRRPAEG